MCCSTSTTFLEYQVEMFWLPWLLTYDLRKLSSLVPQTKDTNIVRGNEFKFYCMANHRIEVIRLRKIEDKFPSSLATLPRRLFNLIFVLCSDVADYPYKSVNVCSLEIWNDSVKSFYLLQIVGKQGNWVSKNKYGTLKDCKA